MANRALLIFRQLCLSVSVETPPPMEENSRRWASEIHFPAQATSFVTDFSPARQSATRVR